MIRTKVSQTIKHKNIFSEEYNKDKKEAFEELEDYIYGKNIIQEKLKEIHSNIEKIGQLCDMKKKSSYDEYNCVLNHNKRKLNEELNRYKEQLINVIKNASREEEIKKLQEDYMQKKIRAFKSNKNLEQLNQTMIEYENNINSLKQDFTFLEKEIKNSEDYNKFLKNKLKELEEEQKLKQSGYFNINNSIPSTVSLGKTNRQNSIINKEKSIFGQSDSKKNNSNQQNLDDADKLRNYFNKTENMIKQKLFMEEKKQKEKNLSLNSMNNFKNQIQEVFRNKIKLYEDKQVSQITEKVSNQEIFFNKSKDSKDVSFTRSQINELKNKSLFTKLNNFDKKEIVKSFLEDIDIKRIIYHYLYD